MSGIRPIRLRAGQCGTADDQIVSPKLSLIAGPVNSTELYVSGGLGFHSNDARGTTTTRDPNSGEAVDPVEPRTFRVYLTKAF